MNLFDHRRITLEQLRFFVAIADEGGFVPASALLGRSQSAITQSFRKLEDAIGCRLLTRRQGHVLGLTAEGNRLLLSARDILARVGHAVRMVREPSLTGELHLGVPDDFDIGDIHGALARSRDSNPKLRLHVVSALSATIEGFLLAGDLDIAIFNMSADRDPPVPPSAYEILRSEPLCWFADGIRSFDEIEVLPLVVFPEGCPYREDAVRSLKRYSKPYALSYVSASYENIRKAVSAGMGIAPLVRSATSQDHVQLGPDQGFPDLPTVNLVMVQHSRKDMVDRFAAFLRQAMHPLG
jgi:DNA-binding transcriptional LysR family regulator